MDGLPVVKEPVVSVVPEIRRVHFVDGLRGWAALIVVIYHAFCDVLPPVDFAASDLWRFVLLNGPLAVYVFFIISGFSLAAPYFSSERRLTLIRLASGRYFRLVIPVTAAVLVMYALMRIGAIPAVGNRGGRLDEIVTFEPGLLDATKFSIYRVFFAYNASSSYITPLWTMRVELFGSFLVLGMCLIVGRSEWRWPAYFFTIVLTWTFDGEAIFGFPIYNYYALFVVGVVILEIYSKGWFARCSWAAPVLLALAFVLPLSVPVLSFPEYFFSAVSVVCAVFLSTLAQDLFSNPCSRWLGRVSFPLYLIHLPVFFVAGPRLLDVLGDDAGGIFASDTVLVALSLVASVFLLPAVDLGAVVSRKVGNAFAEILRTSGKCISRGYRPAA